MLSLEAANVSAAVSFAEPTNPPATIHGIEGIVRENHSEEELGPAWEPCECSTPIDEPDSPPSREFHLEHADPTGEAWQRLTALIDEAGRDGRDEFAPHREIPRELWRQIVTLPATIGNLKEVKKFSLYGSNLIAIPPQIGEMASLEDFDPYTSRRLHWFPYEITRCPALKASRVSTRHLYGNYKTRLPFPSLPSIVPEGSAPAGCSVCGTAFSPTGPIQAWVSLRVATDVLPLLVHACSDACVASIPGPPEYPCERNMTTGVVRCYTYPGNPHLGGPGLKQPPGY